MVYKDYILSLQRRQARYVLYPLVILNWGMFGIRVESSHKVQAVQIQYLAASLYRTNYNYDLCLAHEVSEKGSGKPRAKSVDFTG